MKKNQIPTLLIVIGFLILLSAVGIFLYPRITDNLDKEILPQNLGRLPLTRATYGPEAVSSVIQLHGVDFPMGAFTTIRRPFYHNQFRNSACRTSRERVSGGSEALSLDRASAALLGVMLVYLAAQLPALRSCGPGATRRLPGRPSGRGRYPASGAQGDSADYKHASARA